MRLSEPRFHSTLTSVHSPWLFQATAPSHRHQSKNIALASIFKRCTTLFGSTTVIPIFVFDGPGRPNSKRGVSVRGTSHHLLDDTKALLDALGFAHHEVMAPGEAEAELAWMSANDIIDAVWTEDSDAFVFGATRVFRLLVFSPVSPNSYLKLTDISIYENFALSREQFVFMAVLAGGDYSPGVPNCGIKKSRLLAETGIGDELVRAASRLSAHKFAEYATSWRRRFVNVLREHS
ncbi:PIN domain-like protein, partial [Hymenopellis radicata]